MHRGNQSWIATRTPLTLTYSRWVLDGLNTSRQLENTRVAKAERLTNMQDEEEDWESSSRKELGSLLFTEMTAKDRAFMGYSYHSYEAVAVFYGE